MSIKHISPNSLDIRIVAPNLAVGSGPTQSPIKFYQTKIGEVVQFLNKIIKDNSTSAKDTNNPKKWVIINLRAETPSYSPDSIPSPNEYVSIPIPDHTPPSFHTLLSSISILNKHKNDFTMVHCKHGKGRTGTVVVSYLIWKYGMSFEEANDWFIKKRSKGMGGVKVGVSICSQVRYCQYFERFLKCEDDLKKDYNNLSRTGWAVEVCEIKVTGPFQLKKKHEKFDFRLRCFSGDQDSKISEFYRFSQNEVTTDDNGSLIAKPESKLIASKEDLCCCVRLVSKKLVIGRVKFWINCELELLFANNNELVLEFPWNQMDGFKGTEKRGAKLFDSTSIIIKRM